MSMYSMTDREVKSHFDFVYNRYKDLPEYERKNENPLCLVCNSEVRINWECACGENRSRSLMKMILNLKSALKNGTTGDEIELLSKKGGLWV